MLLLLSAASSSLLRVLLALALVATAVTADGEKDATMVVSPAEVARGSLSITCRYPDATLSIHSTEVASSTNICCTWN
jgi:hypothetical protein